MLNRKFSILLLILLLLLLFSSSNAVYANGVTITLTPQFDKYTYPEGPNPNNPFHFKYFSSILISIYHLMV